MIGPHNKCRGLLAIGCGINCGEDSEGETGVVQALLPAQLYNSIPADCNHIGNPKKV